MSYLEKLSSAIEVSLRGLQIQNGYLQQVTTVFRNYPCYIGESVDRRNHSLRRRSASEARLRAGVVPHRELILLNLDIVLREKFRAEYLKMEVVFKHLKLYNEVSGNPGRTSLFPPGYDVSRCVSVHPKKGRTPAIFAGKMDCLPHAKCMSFRGGNHK